jgi:hypothetical protein
MMPSPQPLLSEQIASRAELIVNHLQETHYTYTEHIEVDFGVYDCDCSQFVGFVLHGVAPRHYEMIPREMDQPRPRAFEYYLFFTSPSLESTGSWSRIDTLSGARRGDIIAWQLPGSTEGDTGHVFFVAETPATIGSRVIDSDVFAIGVYDSAAIPHFDDSREDGEFASGVGTGFINLRVDGAGSPIAFKFGPSEDQFVTLPIAIGRAEPLS